MANHVSLPKLSEGPRPSSPPPIDMTLLMLLYGAPATLEVIQLIPQMVDFEGLRDSLCLEIPVSPKQPNNGGQHHP